MLGSRSLRLIAIPVRRESNFKPPISSLSHLTACKWIVVNSSGARISLGDCVESEVHVLGVGSVVLTESRSVRKLGLASVWRSAVALMRESP